MKINIITLFPSFFHSALKASLLGKAIENQLVQINYIDLRTFGVGKHRIVDDTPYSGGPGLILKVDVAAAALASCGGYKIITSASGKLLNQALIEQFASKEELTILCPRYEGFDERITQYVDCELSIGNYVLSGGEAAALVVIDAVSRLQPGFMHQPASLKEESFHSSKQGALLETPHYTRPEVFADSPIPPVLKSGDHQKIKEWQEQAAQKKLAQNRPDLL